MRTCRCFAAPVVRPHLQDGARKEVGRVECLLNFQPFAGIAPHTIRLVIAGTAPFTAIPAWQTLLSAAGAGLSLSSGRLRSLLFYLARTRGAGSGGSQQQRQRRRARRRRARRPVPRIVHDFESSKSRTYGTRAPAAAPLLHKAAARGGNAGCAGRRSTSGGCCWGFQTTSQPPPIIAG